MSDVNLSEWAESFPALVSINAQEWQQAMRAAHFLTISPGKNIRCGHDVFFIMTGSVCVRDSTRCGSELTLCRVRAGQICWLSMIDWFGDVANVDGLSVVSESSVRVATIGLNQVDAALSSPDFRRFVFREVFRGLAELRSLVEDVAFGRMNQRIANCLLDRSNGGRDVTMTHSHIASELGTAREVVSRQLKEFERHGWVHLQRGKIVINNVPELQRVAEL